MKYEVITTITVDTRKYAYTMDPTGKTRNIDQEFEECKLEFRFNSDALANIVFRDKPNMLKIDNLLLSFDFRGNRLVAVHFEDESYIYMVINFKSFMEICRKEYLAAEMARIEAERLGPKVLGETPAREIKMVQTKNPVLDEFEDIS